MLTIRSASSKSFCKASDWSRLGSLIHRATLGGLIESIPSNTTWISSTTSRIPPLQTMASFGSICLLKRLNPPTLSIKSPLVWLDFKRKMTSDQVNQPKLDSNCCMFHQPYRYRTNYWTPKIKVPALHYMTGHDRLCSLFGTLVL